MHSAAIDTDAVSVDFSITPATVAMPRARARGELSPVPAADEEEVLSTRDFISWIDAPRTRGPLADPLIGLVVADRYRILEPIGHGGMGVVYKVEHTRIGKLLAMKLLTGELSQNADVVRRFKREALTVSKLQSPNTVQVFDFGASEGLTYLVMELVSGENMGSVLRARGPMSAARVAKIVIQLCTSLSEAHAKGIVHRDIKPENVMILAAEGGADVAKVLDFGLAKLREAEALCDITGAGTILGTPYYMAPEQIRGEPVDCRADVYGLGALMYRALTGLHPFDGAPMNVLRKHLYEDPIPPAERAPELGIPAGISRIVTKALHKDPADRFQRVEDLQARLVDEIRAAEASSVARLLDPARLRRLARTAAPVDEARTTLAFATRSEVDTYERELRRKRWGTAITATALAIAAASAGLLVPREAPFSGVEAEPNDAPAEASPIRLGRAVTGHLGKRLDATHGDRDFYAIDLPPGTAGGPSLVKLRVTALPNVAMCTMIYRPGFADPVGQYCAGHASRDLVIPALELPPGRYLFAVLQDLGSSGVTPFVQENVSDTYTVLVDRVIPEPGSEIEPNDRIASATRIDLGAPVSASIGWSRDEDVFCAPEGVAPVRWTVRPGAHERGALEATPLREGQEGAPVRVKWGDPILAAEGERCLRVRLTADPGAPGRATSEEYTVEATGSP